MGRGPSYPFVNLEEAIGVTRKIYEYTKRAAAPTNAVIEHALGYSVKSTSGIKTVAALRSFGLIEEAAQTLRITDTAYRILMDLPESSERKQAIKQAALSPKWYDTAYKKWGVNPPASARSTLIVTHGFIPTTVDAFLKDYKLTMEYAGLSDQATNGSDDISHPFKIGDYVQWESQGSLRMPEAKKLVRIDSGFAFVEGSPTGIPIGEVIPGEAPDLNPFVPQNIFIPAVTVPAIKGETKMQTETFALPEGVTGQLQWPTTMSADAFADFVYQLEGLKMRVHRAVREPKDAGVKLGDENA